MTSAPVISVIIPTCFREEMLIGCVASVLGQSYPEFEVIVIDQAPEARLDVALRKQFGEEKRIRYIHAVSAGAARARNVGVKCASGMIAAFIDDDAVAEPGWLEAIATAFADRMSPALMAGRILPLWDSPRPEWYPVQREYLLGLYDIGGESRRLPAGDMPIGANMAGLRQVILDHGGFEEALGPNYFRRRKMITGEEAILGQRILAAGFTAIYQPNATVRHRISKRKQTRGYFLRRNFWEGVTVIQQMQMLSVVGNPWPHYRYHAREICLALARFILPGYRGIYQGTHAAVRMLALARVCYSLGVWWGLSGVGSTEMVHKQCASA